MKQRIFILGASGNVGRELIKQIVENDGASTHVNPSEIIGIANSKSYIFNSGGISKDILLKVSNSREDAVGVFNDKSKKINVLTDLVGLIKSSGMDGEVVFADVTAGKDELLKFHKYVINNSSNFLVTANKNPISLYSTNDFNLLTSYSGRYDTNTTVMGGAGILNFVNERTNKIADNINNIQGVFSGTLGYILSELSLGEKKFSQIVKIAKENGYTEPNPWDDLNGLDVARKMVILARYSGHNVSIDDVEVEPLISEKYGNIESDKFLDAIKDEDERFDSLVEKAKNNNEVLSYVGEMDYDKTEDKLNLNVGLKFVKKNSDLGGLSGTANLAIVETDILCSPIPHTIKSRGAGLAVTAGAVRTGIAKMLPNNILSK